jgi:hypothetical protein
MVSDQVVNNKLYKKLYNKLYKKLYKNLYKMEGILYDGCNLEKICLW